MAIDNTGPAFIFVSGSLYLRLYLVASEFVLVSYWIALDSIFLLRPVNIFLDTVVWNVIAHAQKPDFVFRETDESI